MAFEVDLEQLQQQEETTANKILSEYFSKNNIDLKTEINAPSEFTTLETIAKAENFNNLINYGVIKKGRKRVYKHKFVIVPKIIQDWIDFFKINMVSRDRLSRGEVSKILIAMKEQEQQSRGLLSKLTGMGKDANK